MLPSAHYSDSYIRLLIYSYFLNPTMFVQLVYIFITKWLDLYSTIDPGAYGISIVSLIADAVILVGRALGNSFCSLRKERLGLEEQLPHSSYYDTRVHSPPTLESVS